MQFDLRGIRSSHRYTVEEVAKHCEVSPHTIRKYESNPSQLPLYLIIKLTEFYGVQPGSLVKSF